MTVVGDQSTIIKGRRKSGDRRKDRMGEKAEGRSPEKLQIFNLQYFSGLPDLQAGILENPAKYHLEIFGSKRWKRQLSGNNEQMSAIKRRQKKKVWMPVMETQCLPAFGRN